MAAIIAIAMGYVSKPKNSPLQFYLDYYKGINFCDIKTFENFQKFAQY